MPGHERPKHANSTDPLHTSPRIQPHNNHLPLHFVWSVPLPQTECAPQVFHQMRFLFNTSQQSLINSLLVVRPIRADFLLLQNQLAIIQPPPPKMNLTTYLGLLSLTEKCLLPFLLRGLIPRKIPLLPHLLNNLLINSLQLHLRARSDHVSGVYSSEWYAIDFEGAGD